MSDSTPMSGMHDCGGDVATYVLGALEPREAKAFEEHLAQCSVCRDEVDTLRGVVQALPMAAPQYRAPRRLRRRVVRAIREEQAPVRPFPRRRSSLSWSPRAGLAGAVVAACAVAVLVAALVSSGAGVGGRLIRAQVTGITGSAQLRVTGNRGELVVHHLSPPSPGHVYEVWLKAPHRNPIPASVLFSVSQSGSADVGLPRSLRGMSLLMVTSEPDGGSPVPTGHPVIVAQLS